MLSTLTHLVIFTTTSNYFSLIQALVCDAGHIETFARSHFSPKNLQSRHPRESGNPSKWLIEMDSRFASIRYANCLLKPLRGNDGF